MALDEAKIRQVKWMLKKGKSKKDCCSHLGISYNTKRLDSLVKEFDDRIKRDKELRLKAKNKVFSDDDKKAIAEEYLGGDPISKIAERYYISAVRVKKFLIEKNVPIRAKGKNKPADVTHVVQNLDVKFTKGDKVFVPAKNLFGTVHEVYDEDWVDYHSHPDYRKHVQLLAFSEKSKYTKEVEDVHYNIYWHYDNGTRWKEQAVKHNISKVQDVLIKTGREFYTLTTDRGFLTLYRDQLYPTKVA